MRKRTVRILTGVAVIVLALGLSHAIAVAVGAAKLRRAYAALEKDGRPMRVEDIVPAEVPDTANGALLYESAALLLKAEPAGQSIESPPGESVKDATDRERNKDLLGRMASLAIELADGKITPEKRQELEQLMEHKAVDCALFAIETGTQRPACRQQRDYHAGINLLLPGLSDVRSLSRIVGAKARLEAQAGAMDRAWDLAVTQAKLADAHQSEPILISQLVRMAVINLSCGTVQRLCEIAPPGPQQRERIETILRTRDDVTPLIHAADGERMIFGEWLFSRSKDEFHKAMPELGFNDSDKSPFMRWLTVKRLTFKPLFLADHAEYVEIMHAYAQSLERPYSPAPPEHYGRHRLTEMLVPALGRIRTLHCQMAAQTRITRAGLALLQYRTAHGAFPATLDALNLDGLSDPFIQGPLHYRTEGEGFIIYSVGEDQKDDGGTLRPERRDSDPRKQRDKGSDIVWRFPATK